MAKISARAAIDFSPPERADLLLVRAFTLGQMKAHGVSPLRESDTAPPLAVSKRVFSILNDAFDDDQDRALADYIELALQLQFNERSRSAAPDEGDDEGDDE